jgi:hypothetical protein
LIYYSLAPLGAVAVTSAAASFGVPAVGVAVRVLCVLVVLAGTLTPTRLARPEALAVARI